RSYKPAFNDIVEFGKLEEESKKAMEQAKSKAEDKEKAIAEAIQKKLDLVSMLYRKAGMPPSMPPDMAKDPVLRQRLVAECQSIMGMGVALEVLSKRIKEAGDAGKAPQNAKDGVAPEELDSSIESEITIESILTADQLVGGIMNGGLAFSDAKIGKAYLSAAYQGYSNMKDGILSIVGFLGAIATTVMVAKDASMSVADRTAEGMSLGGTYATTIVGAANAFYGFTLRGIAEESLSKAQVFTRDTLGNVMGGVMVAAGAIEIAASSIQLGRALSTEKDIQKAKDLLIKKKTEEKQKNQTEQNKTEQAEAKKDRTKLAEKTTLTKDERILARFLLHQNREASRKEVGAGIGIATGAMSVATGALMLAGAVTFAPALAVLAFVGIGVAVAKLATNCAMKKKNREAAVDDFLNVDEKFQMVLAKKKEMAGAGGKATKINEKKLRAAVRKEALAKLGYTSYMDCYRYIVAQAAELLYNKNFVHVPEDETEKQMYSAALDSLGLKTSKNKVQGEEQHPTAAEIYKKLLTA
ncbi:MAG: hypothetical protein IJ679_02290, partial [Lachnospiraceae bacterium]|nr:hypothetical protein [Lachnospiraceae bacterium]